MKQNHRVLIVDDEQPIRDVLSASLMDEGYIVECANNGEKALRMLEEFKPEVVLLDIWMPGRLDGVEVLEEAKKKYPEIEFVIMSGHGTIETAVKTTKYGAWDFIEKPLSIEKVLIIIKNIIELQHEKRERRALLNKLRKSIALIGNHDEIKILKQNIARVAQSAQNVLFEGEMGVGKELSAQNIHYLSANASRPFVYLNTRTLPSDVLEADLFGYNKGALVGADSNQKGKMELAEGGTLYINEVSRLSLPLQEKIMKVISTKKFKRLGSNEEQSVDIRFIAATTENLENMIKEGTFLKEFYEQLKSIPLKILPLRSRKEDIPYLVEHFSGYYAKDSGTSIKNFSTEALELLKTHEWPGNVRELKNFVERIYILHSGDTVDHAVLQVAGFIFDDDSEDSPIYANSLKLARALFEKKFILKRLQENKGNVTKTADQIGVERSHLHRKIKGYGIESQG